MLTLLRSLFCIRDATSGFRMLSKNREPRQVNIAEKKAQGGDCVCTFQHVHEVTNQMLLSKLKKKKKKRDGICREDG